VQLDLRRQAWRCPASLISAEEQAAHPRS
jgi:hypothetical protein